MTRVLVRDRVAEEAMGVGGGAWRDASQARGAWSHRKPQEAKKAPPLGTSRGHSCAGPLDF